MYAASLHDKASGGHDAHAASLLDLCTEIVKSWPSEWCLEANKHAIQVLGGAGYVQDYPVEQLYRDNRLNMIHEGTAGIHALTLLGRKVQGGRAAPLFEAMRATADEAQRLCDGVVAADAGANASAGAGAGRSAECLSECAALLSLAVGRAEEATGVLTGGAVDKRMALTNAHDYLTLMGHTVVAWMWLRSAIAAHSGLDALRHGARAGAAEGGAADAEMDEEEVAFYLGKLHTCQFFYRHELPKTEQLARLLVSGDQTVSEMQAGWF